MLSRMKSPGMIVLHEAGEGVLTNSLFGVWKKAGVSQRDIWGGKRANKLFREEASYVELATPDVLSSRFASSGEMSYIYLVAIFHSSTAG